MHKLATRLSGKAESYVTQTDVGWAWHFYAMASPCEVLVASDNRHLAIQIGQVVEAEAKRIEQKFSRYRQDNIIHRINTSNGQPIELDPETHSLLQYADTCFLLSEGRFDITSGVLRRVWRFDGSDRVPEASDVAALLPLIGWQKVFLGDHRITLPAGMEIDLGGIGKEYAVDRALNTAREWLQSPEHTPGGEHATVPLLISFGGDLVSDGPPESGPWRVGVEVAGQAPTQTSEQSPKQATKQTTKQQHILNFQRGGIATSGDSKRYLLKQGRCYSHVLNPLTGWPVEGAPHSVTVAAGSCTEAGILATLALLQGHQAETFLQSQDVRYWLST